MSKNERKRIEKAVRVIEEGKHYFISLHNYNAAMNFITVFSIYCEQDFKATIVIERKDNKHPKMLGVNIIPL